MLLFLERTDAPQAGPDLIAATGRLESELARDGTLKCGVLLGPPSRAVRLRVADGTLQQDSGQAPGCAEALSGFWIVEAPAPEAASDLAGRAMAVGHRVVAIDRNRPRDTAPDSRVGEPFAMIFHVTPTLSDSDGAKYAEMKAFGEGLKREGRFIDSAPLAADFRRRRFERRGGRSVAVDGPFAETKEVIGGYGLVRHASRDAAIASAARYPHAKWGTVEMREVIHLAKV